MKSSYPGPPQSLNPSKTDVGLGKIRRELLERKRGPGGGGYVMDDEDLLWATSTGETSSLAMPQTLEPLMLALVHSTYAHPRGGRGTALINQRFYWLTSAWYIHNYVLSCGYH